MEDLCSYNKRGLIIMASFNLSYSLFGTPAKGIVSGIPSTFPML